MKRYLLALLLTVSTTTFADQYCFGYLRAEYIYWDSCINDIQYATSFKGDLTPSALPHLLKGKWDPGYRFSGAIYNVCDGWDLFGSYTEMRGKDSSKTKVDSEDSLVNTMGVLTFDVEDLKKIAAKDDYQYKSFDVLIGQDCCPLTCFTILPFAGFEWMELEQKIKLRPESETLTGAEVEWDMRLNGVGAKIGLDTALQLTRSIEAFGRGSVSLLAGTAKSRNHQKFSVEQERDMISFSERETRPIPGYHLKAGIKWDQSLLFCNLLITCGWEFVSWQQKFADFKKKKVKKTSDGEEEKALLSPTATPSQLKHVDFHGPFVGVEVGF